MGLPTSQFARRWIAVAAAASCVSLSPACAVVSVTGTFGPLPVAIGPGDTVLGTNALFLAGSGVAILLVSHGSFLAAS